MHSPFAATGQGHRSRLQLQGAVTALAPAELFDRRKEIFLVTKDQLRSADKMMTSVEGRLKALGTDYIDLFFLHGLGDSDVGGIEHGVKLLKSPEFAKAADVARGDRKVARA